MNVAQLSTWRIAQAHVRRAIPKTPMRMIKGMFIMNTFSTMKAFSHQNRRDTEERLLDDEISELLDPDEPADSVMDSNSSEDERNEDSAEEVDDLLGS